MLDITSQAWVAVCLSEAALVKSQGQLLMTYSVAEKQGKTAIAHCVHKVSHVTLDVHVHVLYHTTIGTAEWFHKTNLPSLPGSPLSPLFPLSPVSPLSPLSPLSPFWQTFKSDSHIRRMEVLDFVPNAKQGHLPPNASAAKLSGTKAMQMQMLTHA